MNQKLEVSVFNKVLDILQAPSYVDREFLYSVYDTCIDIINQFNENDALASLRNINQVELICYCIGEYIYTFGGTDENYTLLYSYSDYEKENDIIQKCELFNFEKYDRNVYVKSVPKTEVTNYRIEKEDLLHK